NGNKNDVIDTKDDFQHGECKQRNPNFGISEPFHKGYVFYGVNVRIDLSYLQKWRRLILAPPSKPKNKTNKFTSGFRYCELLSTSREITSFCISDVPSPMVHSFASR